MKKNLDNRTRGRRKFIKDGVVLAGAAMGALGTARGQGQGAGEMAPERRSAFKARRTVFSGPAGAPPAGSISRESRRAGSTVIVSNRVTGAITVARSW